MINKIRVSYGTAIVLGLQKAQQDIPPTTAYLLWDSGCIGSCSFCPRANGNAKTEKLSRILWPEFELEEVFQRLTSKPLPFHRICLQTGYNPKTEHILEELALKFVDTVIKTSMTLSPGQSEFAIKMLSNGLDHVGIGLDGATKESYELHKKRNWDNDWPALLSLLSLAGEKVEVHLIYGLGDSEESFCRTVNEIIMRGGRISLFALMPVNGGSAPNMNSYRRIQLFRYLCENGHISYGDCTFKSGVLCSVGLSQKDVLSKIDSGNAFRTSGCGNCNRPYYNERPGHEFFNFPRALSDKEIQCCMSELNLTYKTYK